ncbi:hypothetical protein RNI12_32695, partial [Pseudomonas aeruginosa]
DKLAAGKAPTVSIDAHCLPDGLYLGVGCGIGALLATVYSGGEFFSGGIKKHRTHRHIACRGALGDVQGAAHAGLCAQEGL